jgi:hypothetical protein
MFPNDVIIITDNVIRIASNTRDPNAHSGNLVLLKSYILKSGQKVKKIHEYLYTILYTLQIKHVQKKSSNSTISTAVPVES